MFPSRFTSRLLQPFSSTSTSISTSTSLSSTSHLIRSLSRLHITSPSLRTFATAAAATTSSPSTTSTSTTTSTATPTSKPVDPKAARRAARAASASKRNLVTVQERSVVMNDLTGIKPGTNMFGSVLDDAKLDPLEHQELSQVVSYQTANAKQLASGRYQSIFLKYGKFDGDTGSTGVQIAILTERLRMMKDHIMRRNSDMRARYDLNLVYQRRRRLCFYLRRKNMAMYARVMQDLGIDERELEMQGKIWELDPRLASKAFQTRNKRNKKREKMRK